MNWSRYSMVLDTRRVQLSVFEDSVQYYLQDDTNWPRIGVGASREGPCDLSPQ